MVFFNIGIYMAIRKKPPSLIEENKINEIIQKGGSVGEAVPAEEDTNHNHRLTLRIPGPLKTKIDEIIEQDPTCPSLTIWILEAIKQRIQKEKRSDLYWFS
jgi:hypothetical protein